MDRSRNIVAWVALAVAGLALFVSFSGRGFGGGPMAWAQPGPMMQAPAPPQAPAAPLPPGFEQRFGPGADERRFEQRFESDRHMMMAGQMAMGRHGHSPFGMALGLLSALGQLIGLGLLAFLLLRLFQQRSGPPAAPAAPAPPITPAGHDPRVE